MEKRIDFITVGDIGTNCWLYPIDDKADDAKPCIVIDPGDEAPLIISRLKENNWIPQFIFLTHGHYDHLAALPDLVESCESGVFGKSIVPKIGIHRLDAIYLGEKSLQLHRSCFIAAGGASSYIDKLWKPLPEADILFEEGSSTGPFSIIHLPGHTPGSVGFYDEKTAVLFSGDTLFKGNRGRTDLPGGNETQIMLSIKKLLLMKSDITVCPGHGPITSIGDEA